MSGMLVIDIERCIGCKRCEIECAVAHSESKDLFQAISEETRPETRVQVEGVDGSCAPRQCRHCQKAPCLAVCPSEALTQAGPGQPVLHNPDVCISCKKCVTACPFGVIRTDVSDKVVFKCDLCVERLAQGQPPACVPACHVGALQYETARDYPITYTIDKEACKACGRCIKVCLVDAITGAKKTPHVIDQDKCIACGCCRDACPFDSLLVE